MRGLVRQVGTDAVEVARVPLCADKRKGTSCKIFTYRVRHPANFVQRVGIELLLLEVGYTLCNIIPEAIINSRADLVSSSREFSLRSYEPSISIKNRFELYRVFEFVLLQAEQL